MRPNDFWQNNDLFNLLYFKHLKLIHNKSELKPKFIMRDKFSEIFNE